MEVVAKMIIISAVVASTAGFKIGNPQAIQSDRPAAPAPPSKFDYRSQPIAGYPKVPPPNAYESGGSGDDLLPPFEDSPRGQSFRRSADDVKVDPKTGYPLEAQPGWKHAGGDGDSLELPLEGDDRVDPKTGYPLSAQPQWRDAGGDGDIIALPLEDGEENFGQKEEAVDPKTGYPLRAQESWKHAGGNGDSLEPPLEEPTAVDPKTGYPLVAQPGWRTAGGDGEILQPPLEDSKEAVDPKTGYPLVAQPGWKDAGGDEDILQLPLEDSKEAVDPKTGYPLVAQPGWKDAGGDGDILQLPLEDPKEAVDPKTGYPLVAQPDWKAAGGDGDILQLPFGPAEPGAHPKTPNGVSGGEATARIGGAEYHEIEIFKLTELQPPAEDSTAEFADFLPKTNSISRRTSVFSDPNQKQGSFLSQRSPSGVGGGSGESRPVGATYTYTGPDNVVVTVTRFLNTDSREKPNRPSNIQNGVTGGQIRQNSYFKPLVFHDFSGNFGQPIFPQQRQHNFEKRAF